MQYAVSYENDYTQENVCYKVSYNLFKAKKREINDQRLWVAKLFTRKKNLPSCSESSSPKISAKPSNHLILNSPMSSVMLQRTL